MALIIWLILCVAVGYVAYKLDKNPILWGIVAVIISPLFAIIILIIYHLIKSKQKKEDFVEKLNIIYELKQKNILNEDEFLEEKQKIINSIKSKDYEKDLLRVATLYENNIIDKNDLEIIKTKLKGGK